MEKEQLQLFVDELLSQPFDVLLSKALGYAIILGSMLLKVPQILTIVKSKNVKEISNLMYYLETIVYSIVVAYNYAHGFQFNTYGESFFVLIQDLFIVFLLHYYSGKVGLFVPLAIAYGSAVYAFWTGLFSLTLLAQLQMLVIPLSVISRVPQIWSNFSNKTTGSLSFLTFFLNFGGAAARVFTTIKLVDDPLVLAGFVLSAVLNGTIVLQILYYGGNKKAATGTRSPASKKAAKKTQ